MPHTVAAAKAAARQGETSKVATDHHRKQAGQNISKQLDISSKCGCPALSWEIVEKALMGRESSLESRSRHHRDDTDRHLWDDTIGTIQTADKRPRRPHHVVLQ
jgi:hypothetical protein